MKPEVGQSAPPRINPGAFNRAGVETEAGEVEIRLSRYGNWMVHVRPPGAAEWRFVGSGDMESGRLVSNQVAAVEDEIGAALDAMPAAWGARSGRAVSAPRTWRQCSRATRRSSGMRSPGRWSGKRPSPRRCR